MFFKYLLIFITILLVAPISVFAFGQSDCALDLPNAPNAQKLCSLLADIAQLLYIGGLALAFIMIIIGGIKYITSNGDENKTKGARNTIIWGLVGTAIILAAGFLIELVNEFITNRFN